MPNTLFLVNPLEQSNLADLTMSMERDAETIRACGRELKLVLDSTMEMMNELQKCLALRCSSELLSRSKRKATTKAGDRGEVMLLRVSLSLSFQQHKILTQIVLLSFHLV